MSPEQAIEYAGRTAAELNWPWCVASASAKRRRFWPFPESWEVVSRVDDQGAMVTIRVSPRSRHVRVNPVRILYLAGWRSEPNHKGLESAKPDLQSLFKKPVALPHRGPHG